MTSGSAGTDSSHAEAMPDRPPLVPEVEGQLSRLDKAKRRHRQPNMRIGYLAASWCILVPYTLYQMVAALSSGRRLDALLWGALLVTATQLHRFALAPEQTRAARELAKHNDIRGAGHLAEALEWPDPRLRKVAAVALIRLLPEMQASDASLLSADQRLCLYGKLNPRSIRSQPQLVLAILKALEQVGDEAALPYVKKLAEMDVGRGTELQVRVAALACLPFLEQRIQKQWATETLLRPSAAGGASSEILLRPAHQGGATDPSQLLRADAGPLDSP